jgi:hypothetical protein
LDVADHEEMVQSVLDPGERMLATGWFTNAARVGKHHVLLVLTDRYLRVLYLSKWLRLRGTRSLPLPSITNIRRGGVRTERVEIITPGTPKLAFNATRPNDPAALAVIDGLEHLATLNQSGTNPSPGPSPLPPPPSPPGARSGPPAAPRRRLGWLAWLAIAIVVGTVGGLIVSAVVTTPDKCASGYVKEGEARGLTISVEDAKVTCTKGWALSRRDLYSIAYTNCGHDPADTLAQAGTSDPREAAYWYASGTNPTAIPRYDGCLDALTGAPNRYTHDSSSSP